MSTAYLIFRVVDNIEDCEQPFDWQQAHFVEFKQLLQEPTLAPKILSGWSLEDWPGLNPDETQLMSAELKKNVDGSGKQLLNGKHLQSKLSSKVANMLFRELSRAIATEQMI